MQWVETKKDKAQRSGFGRPFEMYMVMDSHLKRQKKKHSMSARLYKTGCHMWNVKTNQTHKCFLAQLAKKKIDHHMRIQFR